MRNQNTVRENPTTFVQPVSPPRRQAKTNFSPFFCLLKLLLIAVSPLHEGKRRGERFVCKGLAAPRDAFPSAFPGGRALRCRGRSRTPLPHPRNTLPPATALPDLFSFLPPCRTAIVCCAVRCGAVRRERCGAVRSGPAERGPWSPARSPPRRTRTGRARRARGRASPPQHEAE